MTAVTTVVKWLQVIYSFHGAGAASVAYTLSSLLWAEAGELRLGEVRKMILLIGCW